MTPRITQEPPLGFIEEPLESSVPLVELTPEASVDDDPEPNHNLVATSTKPPVDDPPELPSVKPPVNDHPELT